MDPRITTLEKMGRTLMGPTKAETAGPVTLDLLGQWAAESLPMATYFFDDLRPTGCCLVLGVDGLLHMGRLFTSSSGMMCDVGP